MFTSDIRVPEGHEVHRTYSRADLSPHILCTLWRPHRGAVPGLGSYRIRSRRASAELMTGFPLCSVVSFCAAPPGWMMETMMMPTTTARKVVHR